MEDEVLLKEEDGILENLVSAEDYSPQKTKSSPNELLRQYELTVRFLNLGCVVSVGCNQIAFSNKDEALKAITDYFNDPEGTREKFQALM
jgi:hypothetical protein